MKKLRKNLMISSLPKSKKTYLTGLKNAMIGMMVYINILPINIQ